MATLEAENFKNLGNEFLKNKEYDRAVEFYTKAIQSSPDNYTYYSNRSAAYASSGRYEEALADAEKTIELNPTWPKGYSRKGAALEYLNRRDEAYEAYQAGLIHDPNNSQLLTSSQNLVDRGSHGSENNFLQQMMSDPRFMKMMSDPEFQKKLSECKGDPSKMMSDPNFLSSFMKYFSPNDDSYQVPRKESPQSTSTYPKTTPSPSAGSKANEPIKTKLSPADQEKELGNKCYFNHQFDEAILHYNKAKELDPNTIIYELNISAVLFHQEKYEECLKLCEEIVERSRSIGESYQNIAKAYSRMGNVYMELKDYEQAVKYYNKSLSEYRDPKVVQKLKESEKILKEEERKKYINPEIAEEEKKIGNSLFAEGKYPEAIKHYSEAISRNPDDPILYSNRAAAYTKLMEYNLCVSDCNKAISLDPKFLKSYLRKANALLSLKDPQQAKSSYEKALEIDSSNREALNGMSKCYEMIKSMNPDEAAKDALRNPEVQEILNDPAMRIILETMQNDPTSIGKYMGDPEISRKIEKLVDAGIIRVGQK